MALIYQISMTRFIFMYTHKILQLYIAIFFGRITFILKITILILEDFIIPLLMPDILKSDCVPSKIILPNLDRPS